MRDWIKEFPAEIVVCDQDGIIVEMNDLAARSLRDEGGYALIGRNLLDCHPESARIKLKQMMENHQANIYTIEKNGVKKLIYQTPWYQGGCYAGLVEISLEIPFEMPHFIRDSTRPQE